MNQLITASDKSKKASKASTALETRALRERDSRWRTRTKLNILLQHADVSLFLFSKSCDPELWPMTLMYYILKSFVFLCLWFELNWLNPLASISYKNVRFEDIFVQCLILQNLMASLWCDSGNKKIRCAVQLSPCPFIWYFTWLLNLGANQHGPWHLIMF